MTNYAIGGGFQPPGADRGGSAVPYTYQPYPKYLFHHVDGLRLVETAEAHAACDGLWQESPALARAAYERLQDQIGEAAAERAYTDRRMSAGAQAELRALERETDAHVLDVPAPPRRPGRKGSE
jgi:hypothetical protein